MRLLIILTFISGLSFAQSLEELFHDSSRKIQEDWTQFELSVELKQDYKSLLMEIAQSDGLEQMEFDTLLHPLEVKLIIERLFKTPYVVPHFCHNFVEFSDEVIWKMSPQQQRSFCQEEVSKLLRPLKSDNFAIRVFSLRGANNNGNFYKVKVMAEDIEKDRSVVINFDVVID